MWILLLVEFFVTNFAGVVKVLYVQNDVVKSVVDHAHLHDYFKGFPTNNLQSSSWSIA